MYVMHICVMLCLQTIQLESIGSHPVLLLFCERIVFVFVGISNEMNSYDVCASFSAFTVMKNQNVVSLQFNFRGSAILLPFEAMYFCTSIHSLPKV